MFTNFAKDEKDEKDEDGKDAKGHNHPNDQNDAEVRSCLDIYNWYWNLIKSLVIFEFLVSWTEITLAVNDVLYRENQ